MKRLWLPVAGAMLVGCSSGSGLAPLPTTPTVTVINPPASVRLGQTAVFNAQLFTPRGARGTNYLEIQVINPSGVLSNRITLNVTQVPGCAAGATQCTAPISFGPAALPLGVWNVTVTVFDQFNQPGGRQVAISVVP
ncbi:MAG: hypothetical protein Q6K08_04810 [Thermostichales cyanobacterium GMQP_bins_62]